MKYSKVALAFLALIMMALAGCEVFDPDPDDSFSSPKGKVEFVEDPYWNEASKAIIVKAKITFDVMVKERDLELGAVYGIAGFASLTFVTLTSTVGSTVLFTGEVALDFIDPDLFRGEPLVVWLDPSNLVTSEAYTGEAEVDLYKKFPIVIPVL